MSKDCTYNDDLGNQILPKKHLIRVTLGKYKEHSIENPERNLVFIDDKPLEILYSQFEFIVNTKHTCNEEDDGFIKDLQDSLERIKGTKGITSISIRVYE